mmetsp:Transcript_110/g.399  ORF Transcript_110/g.399 Transcript_110/m.399 type:complete len:106 (+) Transcript_110:1039-1356(+)
MLASLHHLHAIDMGLDIHVLCASTNGGSKKHPTMRLSANRESSSGDDDVARSSEKVNDSCSSRTLDKHPHSLLPDTARQTSTRQQLHSPPFPLARFSSMYYPRWG